MYKGSCILFQQFLCEFTYPRIVILMELGIYITANIIYLGRELCLGGRVVCLSPAPTSS